MLLCTSYLRPVLYLKHSRSLPFFAIQSVTLQNLCGTLNHGFRLKRQKFWAWKLCSKFLNIYLRSCDCQLQKLRIIKRHLSIQPCFQRFQFDFRFKNEECFTAETYQNIASVINQFNIAGLSERTSL